VVIRGAGFDVGTLVSFGNTPVTINFIDAETIIVSAPSSAVETSVNVTVSSMLGELTLYDGFRYDDDAGTGDTGGSDSGGDVTPTGMTAGLVEFWMQAYACPSCFGLTDIEQVSAGVTRHAPVSGSWLDWLPDVGTCTTDYQPSMLNVSGQTVGDWLYLSTGGSSISLSATNQDGVLSYTASGLSSDDYVRNAQYDLHSSSGEWGLDGALQTTTNFTNIQPENILSTTPQWAWTQPIRASNATFSWAPSGTVADVVVLMEIYHPHNKAYMGLVLCRSSDTGSLTIPSSSFTSYYAQSPVNISIYRVLSQQLVDPSDGHTVEGLAVFGYVGTGMLVP
jgi:hypothetical protein